MQFTLSINQEKALEWGLNTQQAVLFSFIYSCPSWCNPVQTDDGIFFAISKAKIIEELPLLTDKPDTAYRILKQLKGAGVIEMSSTSSITLVRITERGKEWNRKTDGSEKYPSRVGKISEQGRKNIRAGSEKYPTNQDTSNQDTSNQLKPFAPHGECAPDPVTVDQQPAEQKPAPKKLAAKKIDLDYSGWPAHPAPQILADWLASRKNLRAAVTQTVINRMATELHKAAQAGYTVDDCLSLACERGWRGIKAEWVINANSSNQNLGVNHANGRTTHQHRSEVDAAINNWQDTSWAHDLIHGDNPEHY